MRYLLFTVTVLMFVSVSLFGQGNRIESNSVQLYREGLFLGGGVGFGAEMEAAEILRNNPASAANYSSLTWGLTTQFQSDADLPLGFGDITINHQNGLLPLALGITASRGNLSFGGGFYRKYSHDVDLGEIPITTPINPDGSPGDTYRPILQANIHRAALFSAFTLNRKPASPFQLTMAVQAQFDNLRVKETIPNAEATVNEWVSTFKLAALVKLLERVTLGLTYDFGNEFDGELTVEGELLVIDPENGLGNTTPFLQEFPDELSASLKLQLSNIFALSGNLQKIFWNQLTNYGENKYHYDVSLLASPSAVWDFIGGLYLRERISGTGIVFEESTVYYGFLGVRRSLGNFTLSATYADSHLTKEDFFGQRLLRLGVSHRL